MANVLTRKQRKDLFRDKNHEKEREKMQKEEDEVSESFYGPVYSDMGSQLDEYDEDVTIETMGEPGYKHVCDTHREPYRR